MVQSVSVVEMARLLVPMLGGGLFVLLFIMIFTVFFATARHFIDVLRGM